MTEKSSARNTIIPTSYSRKIIITSNHTHGENGKFDFDITNLVTRIEVIENIENPGLEIIISVGDSENYIERLRLSGNEKISVELDRNAHYGKEKYLLDFRVIEVLNFVKEKRGLTTYQMRCISPHILSNQVISKGNSFKGTVGQTIQNICMSDLDIPEKELEIDTATPKMSGVFPKLKPLSAINFLLVNTFDDGTPYYFYETFTNGIKFKSLKSMIDQEPFDKYSIRETLTSNLESDKGYEEVRKRIIEMSSDYSVSKFTGLQQGAFSNTSHFFDIATKKKYKKVYNYKKDSNTTIEEFKPFADLDGENKIKEKSLTDFPAAKNFFFNLNSKSFDKKDNYYATLQNNVGRGYSHLENMEYQSHEILIPGDFRLNVGMIIEIEIPETRLESKAKETVNKVQSGKYLVTNIVHDMKTNDYLMSVTVKRNSSSVDLDKKEVI